VRQRSLCRTDHHVLIVEDDVELRASIADLLKADGYEIDLATNGAEAINHLETSMRPCAVVVDLLMPGIVGQELLEYLRDDVALASIPVAIFSASSRRRRTSPRKAIPCFASRSTYTHCSRSRQRPPGTVVYFRDPGT